MSDKEMINLIKSTQEQIEYLKEESSQCGDDCAITGSLRATS